MDWNAAIERNREALKRILAMLVAMAGLGPHPEARAEGEPRRTLPRHLHRAVLRLLRPAESAARRLVVVMARGLVVPPPPRRADPAPPQARKTGNVSAILRNGVGTGILMPPHMLVPPAARKICLPLFDPLRRPADRRKPTVAGVPRISFPGFGVPSPVRRPPSPDDAIDAARLSRRLAALASALDDLPAHARRLARWQAREKSTRESGRVRRVSPLRGGRPPGSRRRPTHEVHEVLADLHSFAFRVLERHDTS